MIYCPHICKATSYKPWNEFQELTNTSLVGQGWGKVWIMVWDRVYNQIWDVVADQVAEDFDK